MMPNNLVRFRSRQRTFECRANALDYPLYVVIASAATAGMVAPSSNHNDTGVSICAHCSFEMPTTLFTSKIFH